MKITRILGKAVSYMLVLCLVVSSCFINIADISKIGTNIVNAVENTSLVFVGVDGKLIETSASSELNTATNMKTDMYGSVSQSYFYKENKRYYMIFHENSKLYIDSYNTSMKKLSSKTIDDELSLFGGFYSGKKYNFVVYGKSYSTDDKETYRIVKYDKNFNKIASLSIDGDKTYTGTSFDACTSSFSERENTLILYTSRHRMDGHQSNVTLRINEDDMTIADEYNGAASFPTNHCSHIFRSIVKTDTDGSEIYANLTDRTPCCGVSIIKLNKDGNMGIPAKSNVVYTEIEHPEYDPYSIINETDAEVGGLVITDTSYIVTGVYYDNVFVGAVNKLTGEITNEINYNEYSEYGMAQESKLVQIDRNASIVLWQSVVDGIPSVHYVKVDKNGEIKGKMKTAFNALLSDCQPIYDEGTIRWYTIVDGTNTLYTISDLDFKGTFEPLGSKVANAENIWNDTADTSWYKNSVNKFTISSAEQLAGLAELVNNGNDMNGKTIILANDIYLNQDEGSQVFEPIACVTSGVEFSGIFDGAGHTIYRLYRTEPDDSTEGGLFGTIGKYGVVRNVIIDQSYVIQNAGAVAAKNYGTIMFCENMGRIIDADSKSNCYVGGIVGMNYGMVYGCANKGRVTSLYGYAGGIAGYNTTINGCIKACYNSGSVESGGSSSGGIVGYNISIGTVEDCYNIGNVSGSATANFTNYASSVGGIVGFNNEAYIVNCISTINIFKDNTYIRSADSICGNNHSPWDYHRQIFDCYSLYDTQNAETITLDEMLSGEFVEKLNSVTDFYETRLNDMWVKGDFLPITIAQRANELNLHKYYPTACISKSEKRINDSHFGYAKTEYMSDNEKIATVDRHGAITYHGGVGTVTITMTIPETEVSAKEVHEFKFTKYGIGFSNEYKMINKGKSLQLCVEKNYKNTPGGNISYSSDNTSIATVSSTGKVTAISKGSAVITAVQGSDTASCTIYVTDGSSVLTSGKCGTNLSYSLSVDGTMTFSGSGEMTSIPWSKYNRFIKNIKFSDKMTSIYAGAFSECTELKSVTVPKNIKDIGEKAFYHCNSLESINLREGIETIGRYAFFSAIITTISIPASIKTIDEYAFVSCRELKEIISYGKGSIYDAFKDPFLEGNPMENVQVIYGIAGSDANYLADEHKVDFIPLSNKNYKVSFKSSKLVIKKYIGNSANIVIPSKIDDIAVEDIEKDCFVGNSIISTVAVPDEISSELSFKKCRNLKNVKLSNNIMKISNNMFLDCSSLSEVDIPKKVTEIGDNAFESCSSLTKINIPDGVESIYGYAFYNCKKLRSITIPESVTYFGAYAFAGCDQLKCIVIPAQLKSISVYGLFNKEFTTIYSNSTLIEKVCREQSFLSNISYFTIPTQKTTLTDSGITVSGYLPPNTKMETSKSNSTYTIKFLNDGKEIEPCGEITVFIPNSEKNKFVAEIYPNNEELYISSSYSAGKYIFTTQAKNFRLLDAIKGDTNGDGSVDIADALMIARYDAGLVQLDETQLSISDVNKDGGVDIADALMVARFDAGLINSL